MALKDICIREVVTIEPTATVGDAAQLLKDQHVGGLIVVERDGEHLLPIGLLTDRDIVSLVVARGLSPNEVNVEDVMMRNPVTALEHEGIKETAALMREMGVRRLPVVDKDGHLTGVIASDDLLQLLADEFSDIASISQKQIQMEASGLKLKARF